MSRPFNPKPDSSAPIADPIDCLLDAHLAGSNDELTPSSGFVLSVMESVRSQTAEPPPIAFPWRRVVPGAIAVLCGLAALIVFALRALDAGAAAGPAAPDHTRLALSFTPAFTSGAVVLGWVVLAACLSIAAIAASFRLAGRSR
jgi:small-conductance mechanosensitive channel